MPLRRTPFYSGNVRFKPLIGTTFTLIGSLLAGGCPMFSDRTGCWDNRDCAQGFSCDRSSGLCRTSTNEQPATCERPEDCEAGLNCGDTGVCVRGDCTFTGCVEGYRCSSASGAWICESVSAGGQGGGGGEGGRR